MTVLYLLYKTYFRNFYTEPAKLNSSTVLGSLGKLETVCPANLFAFRSVQCTSVQLCAHLCFTPSPSPVTANTHWWELEHITLEAARKLGNGLYFVLYFKEEKELNLLLFKVKIYNSGIIAHLLAVRQTTNVLLFRPLNCCYKLPKTSSKFTYPSYFNYIGFFK